MSVDEHDESGESADTSDVSDSPSASGTSERSEEDGVAFVADSPVAVTEGSTPSNTPTYGSEREQRTRGFDDEEGTADDVDPRGLFNAPTISEIRWYYRHSGIVSTVVDKPVKDAFKNGFEVKNNTSGDRLQRWFEETYVPTYRSARIKARRDGFAFIFWNVTDENTVSQPVENPRNINKLSVWKVEDLANGLGNDNVGSERGAGKAAESLPEYEEWQLDVTRHGIVVVDDIRDSEHGEYIGVYYETNPNADDERDAYEFVHRDRLQHVVNRSEVDGNTDREHWGKLEGDSVISPIFNPAKALAKAEWALGQTLLRYTAPLHVVEIEDTVSPLNGDWEDHIDEMNQQLDGITNKSNVTMPPGHTLDTESTDGNIDPEPFVTTLVNQTCAGAEITRSVLLGTQAGTVSGSSTDIKNYYNQVQRAQRNTHEPKMREAARMAFNFDASVVPSFSLGFELEWEPLFEIDELDRTEAMTRVMTAVTNGVSNYLLKPEDAQDIIEAEWAELDIDTEHISDLDEEDYDLLDRINQHKRGTQYGASEEGEVEGNPEVGRNGGGVETGETEDPDSPTTQE